MTTLTDNKASLRSCELTKNANYGQDFKKLGKHAYDAAQRVESGEGEYAQNPIDGDILAKNTANDVEEAISNIPRVSADFQSAVNDAMPYIKQFIETDIKSRVKNGHLNNKGHYMRQCLSSNIQHIVGLKLGL